ncbi:hypothetical protein [Halanaerobacter jeridensis]|uniref:Uncharacterized protein n=1 Tax=Halanaerobacter jeridensis TaxID=706427 RepID=A0A938XX75_9FIRM|nr:hypothetical protein [Halanaerobacter jeridensis]MBM7556950.1 hypothetical protein [Halanaerobacter jeridensis]
MKRKLAIIILSLMFIITTSNLARASYYDLKMNIGEHISEISNQLFLEEQGQFHGYDFQTELEINKDYRFLSGKSYAQDWEFNDYFLRFTKDNTKLELGETEADSVSTFLSADSLLGVSFKQDNYNLWYGENANEDLNFGGQSNGLERIGFSYDGVRRKYSYHYEEDIVQDRHYFSYQDGYKIKNLDLVVDTALAATEEEVGSAVSLDLSSWYRGISLRGTANYYAPEWQEIEQDIFASGEYDFSLQAYKKLSSRYILETGLDYSRDNLDDSQSFTSRNWSINNTVSYFSPSYNVYQLGVDYQVNNYGSNLIKLSLNGELKDLTVDLNYEQQEEQQVYLELDYEQPQYSYYFNYRLDENNGEWQHDAEAEAEYSAQLTEKWESHSIVNLSYLYDDYWLNVTQGLDYDLSSQQTVEGKLSLNHYFGSDEITPKFIFSYRYRF